MNKTDLFSIGGRAEGNLLMSSIFLLLVFIFFFLSSCEDQRVQTVKWIEYEPVYMSNEEFVNTVGMEEPRELKKPGKIYFYDGYLFVNERNEGVHIIDNSDPSSPSHVGFINIPANKDIAVKEDLLYADSNSDLLVFDIRDMQNAELVSRTEDVFNTSANEAPGIAHSQVDPSKGVVVDWKPVEVEEVCEGDCRGFRPPSTTGISAFSDGGVAGSESAGGASEGVGGSMARFAITGDYLYAVDTRKLITFDITAEEPSRKSMKDVGWNIETIFPHENSLFIGSERAMYIYDITDPAAPARLSVYNHLTACDPVVVEANYAFVTLRNGNRCVNQVNRLEVIDVEDRFNPRRVAFYEMINPHGLGIDDGILFISEGNEGLKIMDAKDPLDVKQLKHIKTIKTFDVIPFNDVLMVTGDGGILQYDYSNIDDIRHLSTIPVSEDEE